MKKGIFAIFTVLAILAMVMTGCPTDGGGGGGGGDTYTITFDKNGGSGTQASQTVEKGKPFTLPTTTTFTPPATKSFDGWSETATGAKITTATITPTKNTTLFAKWKDGSVNPPDPPGPSDDSIIEKFSVYNNVHPLYSFTLPTGGKWSDYTEFKIDLMAATATTRYRHRIVGNYAQEEIDTARIGVSDAASDPLTLANKDIAVLGSWPNGSVNRFIQLQKGGGDNGMESDFPDSNVENGKFFTATFSTTDFTSANGEYDGGTGNPSWAVGRKPEDTATGTFVYGFGFCGLQGQGSANVTYEVTNVRLVSADGTKKVVGMPLVYKGVDNKLYRAFCGQFEDKDGTSGLYTNTQNGKPSWAVSQGADKIVPIKDNYSNPADVTITYTLVSPNSDDVSSATPTAVTQEPGKGIGLPAISFNPPTAPTTSGSAWNFDGWYTAATGGVKLTANTLANKNTTVYGRWVEVLPATITFNLAGGTGTAPNVTIAKGTGLTAAQLALPTGVANGTKKFGGWYTVDTTEGTFNFKDFSKLVWTTNTFSADATLYAYWYTPAATPTGFTVQGGAAVDAEGYFIMAQGTTNAYLTGNANDSLVSFPFDGSEAGNANVKVTYLAEVMIDQAPSVTGKEMNFILKAGTGWTDFPNANPDGQRYQPLSASGDFSRKLSDAGSAGIGFAFNQYNTDGASPSKYMAYRVKIVSVEFNND
jgi:hypothetical protein